jgi:effector-binding domain-containing protein
MILVVVIVVMAGVYAYYGGFKSPEVTTSIQGGELLVYEEILGDYSQSAVVMDKIYYSLLNEEDIETYKGFGIFYDNPQKVERSKLRSEAGCIIEEKDQSRMKALKDKYAVKTFAREEYITSEFPYKGKMSVFMSIFKVYPALNKYAKANGFNIETPVMEIYDIPNKKIIYRKELVQ